jgi:GNAT superfamily N-acetyltransferase
MGPKNGIQAGPTPMSEPDIRRVTASETRALRHSVLRPHQPPEAAVYPGDDAGDTLHLALYREGRQLGIASLYREPPPGESLSTAWRLRGMAVLPEFQGQGLGAALLQRCLDHATGNGGTLVWCNARTTAAGFYRALGFSPRGGEFELPGIGPHYLMVRAP